MHDGAKKVSLRRMLTIVPDRTVRKNLADISIYPAGRTLDPALVDAVVAQQRAHGTGFANRPMYARHIPGHIH